MSIKLDLSQFKHIKSDKNTTTLQHKQGHILTLAHNSLSSEAQKQLSALSKMAPMAETPLQTSEQNSQKMAEGGIPQALSPDTPPPQQDQMTGLPTTPAVGDNSQPNEQTMELRKLYDKNLKMTLPRPGDENMSLTPKNYFFDKNGTPQVPSQVNPEVYDAAVKEYQGQQEQKASQASTDAAMQARQNQAKAALGVPNSQDQQTPEPPQGVDTTQLNNNANATPNGPVTPPEQQQPQAGSTEAAQAGIAKGYQTEIKGHEELPPALAAVGQAQAQAANVDAQARQEVAHHYQLTQQDLMDERNKVRQDILAGHIDPNKYWTGWKAADGTEVPGHSRVASAIGLILGGFNPTSNPNAAINMLKYNMDNSLKAQGQNLDSQHNLLRANLEQFRNERDATDMSRIMMNDALEIQLKAAASQQAGPLAKANADIAIGPLQRESAMLQNKIALSQLMYKQAAGAAGPMNSNPENTKPSEQALMQMRIMYPESAKLWENKVIPGIGVSTQDVTPAEKQQLVGHQVLRAGLMDLQDFVNKNSTKLGNPLDPAYVTGQQKVMKLQAAIREGVLGTVYREGEQPLLDKMMKGNPAGLLKEFVTKPQIQELMRSNDRDYNIKRASVGMRPVQSAAPAGQPTEGSTAVNKATGERRVFRHGSWQPLSQ